MLYEVLIPSAEDDGFDEKITVDASNWMMALKSGLERTGEENTDIRNVMCDIKDDHSIHITDALTRRVFILRELDPEEDEEAEQLRAQAEEASEREAAEREAAEREASEQEAASAEPVPPPVEPIEPAPAPEPAPTPEADAPASPAQREGYERTKSGSWVSKDGRMRVGSATHESLGRDTAERARVVREERSRTSERPAIELERREDSVSENLLEDIFLEIQVIHDGDMEMERRGQLHHGDVHGEDARRERRRALRRRQRT